MTTAADDDTEPKTQVLAVRVPEDLLADLDGYAHAHGVDRSTACRRLLTGALSRDAHARAAQPPKEASP